MTQRLAKYFSPSGARSVGAPAWVAQLLLCSVSFGTSGSAQGDDFFNSPVFHASEIEFTPHSTANLGERSSRAPASARNTLPSAEDESSNSIEEDRFVGMPQACQLSYRIGAREEVHCSGSLVASRIILTAAHCFETEDGQPTTSPVSVGCGYRGQGRSGRFIFAETFTAEAVDRNPNWRTENGSDFAFLHLDHESQIQPLALADSVSRFQEDFLIPSPSAPGQYEFNPSIDCRFSGFGYDPSLKRERFRTSDENPRDGLKGIMDDSTLMVDGYGSSIGELFQGDSGGPLYCRKDASSPWVQVAVLSAKEKNDAKVTAWSTVVSRKFISNWLQFKDIQ